MAFPLSDYVTSLQDIVLTVKLLQKEKSKLSRDEVLFLNRLSDLFDNISDEIRFLIRDSTRH